MFLLLLSCNCLYTLDVDGTDIGDLQVLCHSVVLSVSHCPQKHTVSNGRKSDLSNADTLLLD